jgi:SAM-dependent methyltransferase
MRLRSRRIPTRAADRRSILRSILAPLRPGRLLDLGAGHGKFALVACELGWEVTAVDARTARMPMTEGIEWIEADVRELPVEGYDCILLLGLLYHLELGDQLDLLARCARTLTVIDTHVALRPTHRERGYEGRVFDEDLDEPTAAFGNRTSFWPTEAALVRQLTDAGYGTILKHVPQYLDDRTFWVCSPARAEG